MLKKYTITIAECPDYSLDIQAPDAQKALKCARAIYDSRGEGYFIQNGQRVEEMPKLENRELPQPVRSK